MRRKTVGQAALETKQSWQNTSFDPIEIQKATEKEYIENLMWCINHALRKIDCSTIEGHDQCKNSPSIEGDFFIVVLLKKEKLLNNVLRNYFIPTKACPTPTFDQTVYRWDRKKEQLQYIWTVPDEETAMIFYQDRSMVQPVHHELLKHVIDFYDGVLDKKCQRFNGELQGSNIILEGKENELLFT